MKHSTTLVLVFGLLLGACNGGGQQSADEPATSAAAETTPDDAEATPTEESASTVKVGALYPTSGDIAAAGTNALNGVKLATAVLNGEKPDIPIEPLQHLTIELLPADTQGDPQIGGSEVERLVRGQDVSALIGAYQSSVSLTASERAERLGVPFVNGASGAADLSDRGLKWWFRTGPTSSDLANTYFEWLGQVEHPVDNVAIVHMNDDYGNDFARVLTAEAEEHGVTVVEDIRFEPGATDLSSQVQTLRSSNPDAVFATMFIRDTDLLLSTMEELNYTPPALLAAGGGWDDPTFVDVVGDLGEFNVRGVPWGLQLTDENELAMAVAADFEEEYGVEMNGDSARTFTAMITLGRALEQADSPEPEAIRTALQNISLDETIMPWKGVEFDERGQNVAGGYLVLQLQEGTWEALYPADVATAEVIWPMPPWRER